MKRFLPDIKKSLLSLAILFMSVPLLAEDGYDLWLRYKLVDDQKLLVNYRNTIKGITIGDNSPTLFAAREVLQIGLYG